MEKIHFERRVGSVAELKRETANIEKEELQKPVVLPGFLKRYVRPGEIVHAGSRYDVVVRIQDPHARSWKIGERPMIEKEITLESLEVEVPESWRSALSLIQKVDPNAFIVGGSLRDLVRGCVTDVNDLDIFTTSTYADWQKVFTHIEVNPEYFEYEDVPEVTVRLPDCPELHVTHFNLDLPEALATATYSLGQVACDGEAVWATPLFLEDMDRKQLHVLDGRLNSGSSAWSKVRSLQKRLPYSDFTIIDA